MSVLPSICFLLCLVVLVGWRCADVPWGACRKDQDPIVGPGEVPIFGVDMWEHAYYLQVRLSASCVFFLDTIFFHPFIDFLLLLALADVHRLCAFAVPQRQGCVRREHLDRHQLEDG